MLQAQTITTVSTYNNIGVEITFTSAPPAGTVANVFVKKHTASVYTPAHPLTRISNTMFAGSIVQLEENTSYDIKITSTNFSDILRTLSTKNSNYTQPNAVVYYVDSAAGNDSYNGTSIATAFKTIGKALNTVSSAGSTIYIRNGTYYEGDYTFSRSGTTNNPITIRNYPGHHPKMNGTDITFSPTWVVYNATNNVYRTSSTAQPLHAYMNGKHMFHYLVLNDLVNKTWDEPCGFYCDGSYFYVRFPSGSAPANNRVTIPKYSEAFETSQQSNIVIKGIEFCYYGYGEYPRALYFNATSNVIIDSCNFHQTNIGVGFKRNSNFNLVQHCTFNESPKSKMNWDAVKEGGVSYEAGGICIYTSDIPNSGNVFRYNTFTDMFDAMSPGSEDDAGYTSNMDIHDNIMNEVGDDGISLDGVARNIRVYNNKINNCLVGVSAAPLAGGPSYIFRNLIVNSNSSGWSSNSEYKPYPFKFNVGSSFSTNWVYLYHNTCFTDISGCDGFLFKDYSDWHDIISRNNIYMGTSYAFRSQSSTNPIDFNYDNFYTTHGSNRFYWNGSNYNSLANFSTATGQETNGLYANPSFVSIPNSNFMLSSTSQAIDKGQVIPGFNDDFKGQKPDMGKYEYNSVTGIIGISQNQDAFVYPNPNQGRFVIKKNGGLEIYNSLGKRIIQQKLISENTEIDISNQPKGIYYVRLKSNNKIQIQKIVIQ